MVEMINIEDFVDLPTIMLDNSKNIKYIQLLSENTVNTYYYTDLKKDLMSVFNKFKDSKHIIAVSNDYSLKSNMSDLDAIKVTQGKSDKVSNYIEKKIDLSIWSKDIYYILLNLLKEITFQEALYLVSTFFDNKTEDTISEILEISKKSLYKIKKSCLVKIKLEFDKYNIMY